MFNRVHLMVRLLLTTAYIEGVPFCKFFIYIIFIYHNFIPKKFESGLFCVLMRLNALIYGVLDTSFDLNLC
jgi:hypothetical protein